MKHSHPDAQWFKQASWASSRLIAGCPHRRAREQPLRHRGVAGLHLWALLRRELRMRLHIRRCYACGGTGPPPTLSVPRARLPRACDRTCIDGPSATLLAPANMSHDYAMRFVDRPNFVHAVCLSLHCACRACVGCPGVRRCWFFSQ